MTGERAMSRGDGVRDGAVDNGTAPQAAGVPVHVGIIMDGNGRWATARSLPRVEGHRRGVEALRRCVRAAREIGIRKAIGARRRDIMLQFLVESTVLSVLGGIIGILLSFLGSWLIKTYASLDASLTASPIMMAFLFSLAVGVFFGMLPAYKAAKLRPIEALRYE